MVIELTAEQETQLHEIAALQGRTADEVVITALDRALAEERRFAGAVKLGLDDIEGGDLLEPEEVWTRVEAILNRR